MSKLLDRSTKRIMKNSVLSTIINYYDCIDFEKIADKNILAYRYLLLNLIRLKDDKKERDKRGLTKK